MLSCKMCLNGYQERFLVLSFKSNSLDVPGLLFCSFFVFLFFVGIWIGIFGGGGDCLNWNKKQDGGAFIISDYLDL